MHINLTFYNPLKKSLKSTHALPFPDAMLRFYSTWLQQHCKWVRKKQIGKENFQTVSRFLSEILEIIGHYFGLLGLPISLIFSMEVDVLNFFIFHPNLCTSLKILINTS